MPRYPWSDGTNFVTQCPIRPDKRFRQRIILSDEEGTLWWHAHSDWSRNTVYGAIVILPPRRETYPYPKPYAHHPILIGTSAFYSTKVNLSVFSNLGGFYSIHPHKIVSFCHFEMSTKYSLISKKY